MVMLCFEIYKQKWIITLFNLHGILILRMSDNLIYLYDLLSMKTQLHQVKGFYEIQLVSFLMADAQLHKDEPWKFL
jgi:hypothetical protein